MAVQLKRHTFTVDDYHRMLAAGILTEDDRVELIKGEIIAMAPVGPHHAYSVKGLNNLLAEGLGERAVVGIQDPITVGEYAEPQPDVSVARPPRTRYTEAHPTPADLLLVIEVSDTTILYDRETKVPLYARAGIPEVWIVDLEARRIEAYREPTPNGYHILRYFYPGETIAPSAFPDVTLPVDEVLV